MKNLGFGLGLRTKHYERITSAPVQVDWFEALTENYIGMEGQSLGEPIRWLEHVRARFPVVLHGVSLSLAGSDPLNRAYLRQLKNLKEQIAPEWISDHLCWTRVDGENLHDLLPIPFSKSTLDHVIARIQAVQDFLGAPLVVENVSSYLEFKNSEMPEWEFLRELSLRSGCKLLVDVNNIYVSAVNHGFSAFEYLQALPRNAVQQIHLAGHSSHKAYLIDTHDAPVCAEVWQLYRKSVELFGAVSTMVEWDAKIPEFSVLESELNKARSIQAEVLQEGGSYAVARPAATL